MPEGIPKQPEQKQNLDLDDPAFDNLKRRIEEEKQRTEKIDPKDVKERFEHFEERHGGYKKEESAEATPLEWKEKLKKAVEELSKKTSEKRQNLLGAEDELVEAEKEHYTEHGVLNRAMRKIAGTSTTYERKKLNDKTDAAAAEYEQALEDKLAARLAQKNLSEADAAKLAARYRRSVISRDVIDRGEKKRTSARESTLAEKGSSSVERSLHWLKRRNDELDKRLGKTGGRIVRVFLSATAGTAVAVAFGPASLALVGSVWATRAVRSAVGSFGGAVVGMGAGKIYEKTGGARSEKRLERARVTKAQSAEDIAAKREAYRAGNAEAIERKRKYVEMVAALLSGAGLSLATAYELAGHGIVHSTISNLGGNQQGSGHALDHTGKVTPETTGEAPAMVEPTPEIHVAPEISSAPEMPHISVDAAPGHGYEFMAKRIYEQLHAQHLDPNKFAENSDIHKLLTADQSTINGVVHNIAKEHGFFNAETGTNVQINLHDQMEIGADGNIHLDGSIHAPPGAHVTPAYHPHAEAHVAPQSETPAAVHAETKTMPMAKEPENPTYVEETKTMPMARQPENPVTIESSVETQAPAIDHGTVEFSADGVKFEISANGAIHYAGNFHDSPGNYLTENWKETVANHTANANDYVNGQGLVLDNARSLEIHEKALEYLKDHNLGNSDAARIVEGKINDIKVETGKLYGNVFKDNAAPTHSIEAPTPHAPVESTVHEITNQFGLKIPIAEPHIYADGAKHLFAYGGGDAAETSAQEFALEHHASVFVDKSYQFLGIKIPRVIEFVPTDTGAPAMVIHNDSSLVPDIKKFEKLIK